MKRIPFPLVLLLSFMVGGAVGLGVNAWRRHADMERRIEALEAEVFARDCGNPGAYVEPPTCTPGPRVR